MFAASPVADRYRPDVAAAYPSYGAYRGYDAVVPSRHGAHTVCVYAINVSPPGTTTAAGNPNLGCRSYDVPAVANVESLYSGQWLVAFDDNVIGETEFQVRWDVLHLLHDPGHAPAARDAEGLDVHAACA